MSDAVIRRMNPPTLPTPPGYSQVVAAAGARETILVSGQVALDQEGKLVGAGNPTAQADQAFKNLAAAVRAAGAEPANIIKLTTFVTDMAYLPHVREARDRHLDRANPPASTLIGVTALFRPEFLIEVEAVAVR